MKLEAHRTTVIITGAKTGIGRGLLTAYAARSDTIVIAAIRDGPNTSIADDLQAIRVGKGSEIIVAKYDASSHTAGKELISYLQQNHNINHLDVVVANAGILNHYGPSAAVEPKQMLEHFQINSLGPLLLYQATAELLKAAQAPKFFVISSTLGSNSLIDSYPLTAIAYSVSKAAVNFIAGKLHREDEKTIIIPVQPGWVQTAMGEKAAQSIGLTKADVPVTIDQSVTGLINLFDTATKEEHSGKFWDQDSKLVPW